MPHAIGIIVSHIHRTNLLILGRALDQYTLQDIPTHLYTNNSLIAFGHRIIQIFLEPMLLMSFSIPFSPPGWSPDITNQAIFLILSSKLLMSLLLFVP